MEHLIDYLQEPEGVRILDWTNGAQVTPETEINLVTYGEGKSKSSGLGRVPVFAINIPSQIYCGSCVINAVSDPTWWELKRKVECQMEALLPPIAGGQVPDVWFGRRHWSQSNKDVQSWWGHLVNIFLDDPHYTTQLYLLINRVSMENHKTTSLPHLLMWPTRSLPPVLTIVTPNMQKFTLSTSRYIILHLD